MSFKSEAQAEEFYKVCEEYSEDVNNKTLFGWFVPIEEDDDNWSRAEKWGTKWDAQMYAWRLDGRDVFLYFDTAWAPPIEVYHAALEKGILVHASFNEIGMCFVGLFDNGQEEFYEYSTCTSENVREHIGDYLDDEWNISTQMKEWEQDIEDIDYASSSGGVENFG